MGEPWYASWNKFLISKKLLPWLLIFFFPFFFFWSSTYLCFSCSYAFISKLLPLGWDCLECMPVKLLIFKIRKFCKHCKVWVTFPTNKDIWTQFSFTSNHKRKSNHLQVLQLPATWSGHISQAYLTIFIAITDLIKCPHQWQV